jgi:DNA-damage-inducible protein D
MSNVKLFESQKIRSHWDAEKAKWYFSVVDVIEALTESPRPRKYWNALKTKLQQEGSELSQNLGQLKMQSADGKSYVTDVADTEQLLRLIQSIPSPKERSPVTPEKRSKPKPVRKWSPPGTPKS